MVSNVCALLAALVVTHCVGSAPPFCPVSSAFEAHNVVEWFSSDTGPNWVCDGTIWWELRLDNVDPPVVVRCMEQVTPMGDTLVYCPSWIAPVKYWDRVGGTSAWLTVSACNDVGCVEGCTIELIWPSYTCFNTSCAEESNNGTDMEENVNRLNGDPRAIRRGRGDECVDA